MHSLKDLEAQYQELLENVVGLYKLKTYILWVDEDIEPLAKAVATQRDKLEADFITRTLDLFSKYDDVNQGRFEILFKCCKKLLEENDLNEIYSNKRKVAFNNDEDLKSDLLKLYPGLKGNTLGF